MSVEGFQPVKPMQERVHTPEPEWRARLLENSSAKDREVLGKMRDAFTQRGLNHNWCYEGSGLDITPLLFAPDGVTIQMVDPMYEDMDNANFVKRRVQQSFIGNMPGVRHEQLRQGQRTSLEGGITLDWVPAAAEHNAKLSESIDMLYTNFITQPPSVAALHALHEGGVVVIKGIADNVEHSWEHHPTSVASMKELGFTCLQNDIYIDNAKPQGVAPLTNHVREGAPANFVVYKKTREFTESDSAGVILNTTMQQMYTKLRWLVYSFNKNESDFAQFSGHDVQQTLQLLEANVTQFAPSQKEQIFQRFFSEMQQTILDKTAAEVTQWMLQVDGDSKEYDFVRNVTIEDMPNFVDQLDDRVFMTQHVLKQFFVKHGLL